MIYRLSHYWLPTQKETPAEAEVISHQLMIRAGMIRQSALGIYSWLPLGLRVLRNVERIIREEMSAAGAIETLMPMVQSASLWQESGRWNDYGAELRRLKDRHERDYCLGPTHEEVITDLVRRDLNHHKQLPINLYQIQTKFRDEIRPRFGVMRSREFVMKDAYSFHLTPECLQQGYDAMYNAYHRIFKRLGLDYCAVLADNGSIGGTGSHEFHVLAQTGEDVITVAEDGSYAANLEKASAAAPKNTRPAPQEALQKRPTPNCKTIAALVEQHQVPIQRTLKTLLVKGQESALVALVVRGDHELNPLKAEALAQVAQPFAMADEALVRQTLGAGFGSLGVVGLREQGIPVIVDRDAALVADFAVGANEEDHHYFGVNWERDAHYDVVADLRNVIAGDEAPTGSALLLKRGIEVGHVFQLGSKYSAAMNLKVTLEGGAMQTVLMGCYGIGVTRVVAAAIEQNHDERGIIWTDELAPFQVAILPINADKAENVRQASEDLAQQLSALGWDVVVDDRHKRPGVMFADMDLIGIPHRVVISEKTLANQQFEYKSRRADAAEYLSLEALLQRLGR